MQRAHFTINIIYTMTLIPHRYPRYPTSTQGAKRNAANTKVKVKVKVKWEWTACESVTESEVEVKWKRSESESAVTVEVKCKWTETESESTRYPSRWYAILWQEYSSRVLEKST